MALELLFVQAFGVADQPVRKEVKPQTSDESVYGIDDVLLGFPVEAVQRDESADHVKSTLLWEYLENLHKRLPFPREFFKNIRSAMRAVSDDDGSVPTGDGCTGSGVRHHFLAATFAFWHHNHVLPKCNLKHIIAAESNHEKQQFIRYQHSPACIVKDVSEMANDRWHNVAKERRPMLAKKVKIGGGGFSCTGRTKANDSGGKNKGCIRKSSHVTGTTFDGIFN